MKIKLIIFVLIFSVKHCFGQTGTFRKYSEFLQKDTILYCPMFTASLSYLYTTPGKVSNAGQGFVFGGGFNVARLFTKKFILGGFLELKPMEGIFWPYRYNPTFSQDLALNSDFSNLEHIDSLYAGEFVKQTSTRSLYGTVGSRFGLMFSLPNEKFPMIKLYKKSISEVVEAYYFNNTNFGTEEDDIFFSYDGVGVEILKLLFIESAVPVFVCLFYEKETLAQSSIEGVRLNTFMNDNFMNKYHSIHRFGMKIGIGRI